MGNIFSSCTSSDDAIKGISHKHKPVGKQWDDVVHDAPGSFNKKYTSGNQVEWIRIRSGRFKTQIPIGQRVDADTFARSPIWTLVLPPANFYPYFRSPLHSQLGKGGFSVVLACTSKETGEKFAVKCIKKIYLTTSVRPSPVPPVPPSLVPPSLVPTSLTLFQQEEVEALQTEIDILKRIDHPHVMRLHDHFEEPKMCYLGTIQSYNPFLLCLPSSFSCTPSLPPSPILPPFLLLLHSLPSSFSVLFTCLLDRLSVGSYVRWIVCS
jgi:hypothetical protein